MTHEWIGVCGRLPLPALCGVNKVLKIESWATGIALALTVRTSQIEDRKV